MTNVNDMSEERAITVLTCHGDVSDPSFPRRLQKLVCKLHRLVNRGKRRDEFQVTKVEPWNSVRVTFNIPREAAERLQRLAESGDRTLREMGILSVQVDGDQIITLTLANSVDLNLNSAITELGVTTNNTTTTTTSTSAPPLRCNTTITDPSPSSSSSSPPSSSLHRIHSVDSSSSPTSSLRDVCKNIHQPPQHTTAAIASRSVSVSLSVSPSRGLSAPPTPPDSVSLESRPESASLEESINPLSSADPLKSQQLLHSSSSSFSSVQLNTNKSATNNSNSSSSCVILQQPPSTTDQYHSNRIKDPNIRNDLSSQMTIDVSGPPLASFLRNESSPSFRSPNVLVTDPLHIVPPPQNVGVSLSSSSPSASPSVSSAMVLSAIVSQQPLGVGGGKRKNSSQSSPSGHNLVSVPFPFTSMQHAMHTKQGNSNHPRSTPPHHHHHLVVSPPDKSHHEVDSRSRSVDITLVPSSRMTLSSCSSIGPVVATSSSSISTNRSGSLSEVSHTAAAKSASSNVALASPLLVNLLQNESSQITTTTESKSSLKLSSSTKLNMNWNDQRTANDPSSDHQSSSASSSARSTSSSGLPKQQQSSDLNPINDLRVMIPATTLSVPSSSAPSSSEPSVSSQVVTRLESKTVPSSPTCNSRNDISVRSSRHTNAENASTSHSVTDMVLLTMATDDRNGTVHHDEEEDMNQDLNNHDRRNANSLVNDTDRGRRVDQETNNTRNDILKHLINCHPSSTSGGNNASSSSNHGTESLERISVPSHTTTDGNNAHNQQPSVNGKYDVLSEDEDDDDGDEIIGDEEVLDDVDLDDEMSDLPPLEPADMAMDIDDDCDSSELCNTSTTHNILNCVFEEAVSLGSLDGRQVFSVASGDHNYISVKIESDPICRSNSAHSDHREMDLMSETIGGVDPSLQHPTSHHSDLELRPNFNKCSNEDSVKKQKIKSEKDDTVNESGSSSQNKHPVTDHHHPESSTVKVETIVTTNNCHSKRGEDSGLDTGGNSRNKLLHRDKVATKKNQSGVSKKLLSTDKPDSPSGLERKVNSSKMKVTSESLSADIFLVNAVGNPIQPDAQTSSMVEDEEEFFNQSESNHAISQAAVSILKKKKSKGSGGGSQQVPDPESGMVKSSRRRVVKSEGGGGGGGGTNNRL